MPRIDSAVSYREPPEPRSSPVVKMPGFFATDEATRHCTHARAAQLISEASTTSSSCSESPTNTSRIGTSNKEVQTHMMSGGRSGYPAKSDTDASTTQLQEATSVSIPRQTTRDSSLRGIRRPAQTPVTQTQTESGVVTTEADLQRRVKIPSTQTRHSLEATRLVQAKKASGFSTDASKGLIFTTADGQAVVPYGVAVVDTENGRPVICVQKVGNIFEQQCKINGFLRATGGRIAEPRKKAEIKAVPLKFSPISTIAVSNATTSSVQNTISEPKVPDASKCPDATVVEAREQIWVEELAKKSTEAKAELEQATAQLEATKQQRRLQAETEQHIKSSQSLHVDNPTPAIEPAKVVRLHTESAAQPQEPPNVLEADKQARRTSACPEEDGELMDDVRIEPTTIVKIVYVAQREQPTAQPTIQPHAQTTEALSFQPTLTPKDNDFRYSGDNQITPYKSQTQAPFGRPGLATISNRPFLEPHSVDEPEPMVIDSTDEPTTISTSYPYPPQNPTPSILHYNNQPGQTNHLLDLGMGELLRALGRKVPQYEDDEEARPDDNGYAGDDEYEAKFSLNQDKSVNPSTRFRTVHPRAYAKPSTNPNVPFGFRQYDAAAIPRSSSNKRDPATLPCRNLSKPGGCRRRNCRFNHGATGPDTVAMDTFDEYQPPESLDVIPTLPPRSRKDRQPVQALSYPLAPSGFDRIHSTAAATAHHQKYDDRSLIPCVFLKKGYCRDGPNCPYNHNIAIRDNKKQKDDHIPQESQGVPSTSLAGPRRDRQNNQRSRDFAKRQTDPFPEISLKGSAVNTTPFVTSANTSAPLTQSRNRQPKKNKKHIPCTFYQQNRCRKTDDECEFGHFYAETPQNGRQNKRSTSRPSKHPNWQPHMNIEPDADDDLFPSSKIRFKGPHMRGLRPGSQVLSWPYI